MSGPVEVLAGEWLAGRAGRGEISAGSAGTYRDYLARLIRFFGDRPVEELTRRVLLEWQLSIGDLQPASRRRTIGVVKQFCRWLVEEGHLPADPAAGLSKPREPRSAPRALPAADIPRIIDACPQAQRRYRVAVWLLPAVWLMLGCGLRCGEVASLDLDDYDRDRRALFVRGKGGHQRVLPVPSATAAALDEYLASRGGEPGPLLRAVGSKAAPSRRLSPKWIAKRTGRLMTAAGVHRTAWDGRTAHAFRHTFATDCLAASGNDVLAVQALLGHTSLQTTQRYLAPAGDDRLRQAVEGRSYAGRSPEPVHVRLHCEDCCEAGRPSPGGYGACDGWYPVPVEAVTVTKTRSSTGWWYTSTCPECRGPVTGDLPADSARAFLRHGARGGIG